jgi:N-acetylglucosaminyldiphosphoundecaprenol N-acetyl-beta-D-mannosaminyltransferase
MALSDRARILNGTFDRVTLNETLDQVMAFVREGKRGWLCTVNVAILMMMREDLFLQRFVDDAAFIVADGQPLVWVSPLFGAPLPERVTGVDLVVELSRRAAAEKAGVYLLGANADIVHKVADELKRQAPGLIISGVADGYFGPDEAKARASAVKDSGARILFVAMGVPRQEKFLREHWDELGVNMAIGVGGSFDVIAGLRSRAPELVQKIGMEWAYRLAQEPKRLAKRYFITNSQFVFQVSKALLARGPASRSSDA